MAVTIGPAITSATEADPVFGRAGGQAFDRGRMGDIRFEVALERFKGEVKQKFVKRISGIIDTVHDGVIAKTPVDTGQAVANWQVTMNAPFTGVLGGVGPHDAGARDAPLGGERNRVRAEAVARASRMAIHFRNPFIKFWVSNNTPFILDLEYGEASPRKAPAGMLGVTIAEVRSKLGAA